MLLLLLNNALADFDDLRLTAMLDWDGRPYTSSTSHQAAYMQVSKQLGAAIATSIQPARTMGIWGFELTLHQSFSFIDADKTIDNNPSAWALMTPDEDIFPILCIPRLQLRKGLPLSSEISLSMGYILFSRQSTFGAAARIAPVEGYHIAPDIALQVGYNAYIGGPEFHLGTIDYTAILSKEFGFGYLKGMTTSTIAPFVAVGAINTHVSPKISGASQDSLSIGPISGFSSSTYFTEELSQVFLNGGLKLNSHDFSFQVDYRHVFSSLSTVSMALSWEY
ncbi:MAG: hypothetical protein VX278_18775 [Myxococcota bacterium]|nr:hypothetical protein [Myxococcota bacterium]